MARCVVCEVVVLGGGSPKIGNNIDAFEETSCTCYRIAYLWHRAAFRSTCRVTEEDNEHAVVRIYTSESVIMIILAPADPSQPPLLTLFSSTSIPPLTLFQTVTGLSSKSSVTVVDESNPRASSSSVTGHLIGAPERGILVHPVLHLQSPAAQDTYIQAGVSRHALNQSRIKGKGRLLDDQPLPLGIELPWLGMQIRPLGKRPMSFELGVVDTRGREGVIRISSFKVCSIPVISHLIFTLNTLSRPFRRYIHIAILHYYTFRSRPRQPHQVP